MATAATLTLNAGSSSLKFAVFDTVVGGRRIYHGAVDNIGQPGARFWMRDARLAEVAGAEREFRSHSEALGQVLSTSETLPKSLRIVGVGHRAAHGGPDCDCPEPVTPALMERLRRIIHLAPLHLPANIEGIEAMSRVRPDLPQVVCFDTAFHHHLPRVAQMTGLPRRFEAGGLRRFGFHGLSYEFIVDRLRAEGADVAGERIVVAHLGNGASLAAIRDGRSVETTMGFSTLSGVPMGTRSGDIDAGLLLHLQRYTGLTLDDAEDLLFSGAGLLGLSGISRDMRQLLVRHDAAAAEAVEYFCYHVRRHLAGLTAALGGLDRVVFTGGIGANAPRIRERVCAGLGYLGLALDPVANDRGEIRISTPDSPVAIEARRTDEEAMIAEHVRRMAACRTADRRKVS